MAIPAGVIFMHAGTNASIAAGYSRVASLDGRFIKGTAAGVNPDVTGGALTHTHTSPAHGTSHSIAAHTHASNPAIAGYSGGSQINVGGTSDTASTTHTHTVGTSSSGSGATSTTVGTWQTGSSEPAYVEVIFIVSDGTPTGVADGDWAFWDGGSLPTNWSLPAAAQNKHPKGAAAAGNGGGTGGGGSHAHVANTHAHAANHTHTVTSGNAALAANNDNPHGSLTVGVHSHTVTFSGGSVGSGTSANTGGTTYEPPWKKLAIVQNDTGGFDLPVGIIGMTLGLLSGIPSGYALCDGANSTPDMRGVFPKGVAALGELGNTDGTAGHDHADPATHTHTGSHSHTLSTDASAQPLSGQVPFTGTVATSHTHSGTSSADGPVNTGADTQTVDTTADTQPPFRTVAFIKFVKALEVTVDEPEEDAVLGAPSQLIAWSLAFDPAGGTPVQNDYRVRVFADDLVEVVYDSSTVASATQEHQLPSGFLHNDLTYFIQVDVTDTLGLSTESALRQVTTSWVPPATITNLTAVQVGG